MLVIRIEDKENYGPWSSDSGSYVAFKNSDTNHHNDNEKCPGTYKDGISFKDEDSGHYSHAVSSLDLYQDWFTEDNRKALQKAKFKTSIYKVPKKYIIFGKRQVVFKREKSKLVAQFKPTEIKKIKEFLKKAA